MTAKLPVCLVGVAALSLIGCATPEVKPATNTAPEIEAETTAEVTVPETMILSEDPAEVIEELAVEPPAPEVAPIAQTAVESDIVAEENRVVAQEQPVGDQPVMNPAGETLIKTAQVTFPNGRERLEIGKDYQIRWESEGIKAMEIELHQFGRRTALLAERALAVEGVFNWTPSEDLLRGNDFAQLTVILKDADTGIVHDESDSAFILLKPA